MTSTVPCALSSELSSFDEGKGRAGRADSLRSALGSRDVGQGHGQHGAQQQRAERSGD
ncbi:MAG: hypothetical protein WDO56_22640 [Gammaproteobacteria bacterium]